MTMTGNGSRRAELAAFLRSRRERITPEQVGLSPGLRRRTPGLRREEVAQLAGVGVTWYTWLEQGRPINASAQVLGAVAQTLRLDHAERQHLYRLADMAEGAAGAGDGGSACEQVPPDVQGIIDGLVPLPASVMNERYDLLGWNEAYAVLWPGVVGAQPGERNILWQNFTYPTAAILMSPGTSSWPGWSRSSGATTAGTSASLRGPASSALSRRPARTSPGSGTSTTWPARSPTSRSSGTRRTPGWS